MQVVPPNKQQIKTYFLSALCIYITPEQLGSSSTSRDKKMSPQLKTLTELYKEPFSLFVVQVFSQFINSSRDFQLFQPAQVFPLDYCLRPRKQGINLVKSPCATKCKEMTRYSVATSTHSSISMNLLTTKLSIKYLSQQRRNTETCAFTKKNFFQFHDDCFLMLDFLLQHFMSYESSSVPWRLRVGSLGNRKVCPLQQFEQHFSISYGKS